MRSFCELQELLFPEGAESLPIFNERLTCIGKLPTQWRDADEGEANHVEEEPAEDFRTQVIRSLEFALLGGRSAVEVEFLRPVEQQRNDRRGQRQGRRVRGWGVIEAVCHLHDQEGPSILDAVDALHLGFGSGMSQGWVPFGAALRGG